MAAFFMSFCVSLAVLYLCQQKNTRMKILVNGREAVLKANASFEYVSENPLFTEAEDYTMEIPFPMKDCPQNISIFGPLHVKGVDISKVSFPCEIQTDAFVKSGILTITSVSDTEVKGQFLEGMSQENFSSSLPNIYLTDMDFSAYDGQAGGWEGYPDYTEIIDPEWGSMGWQANKSGPEWGWDEVPVWDLTKERIILPLEEVYGEEDRKSRRIYLSHLIKLVGLVTGWTIDDSAMQALPMYKYILVANARLNLLTDSNIIIRPLSLSLPRWTVIEFLDQLSMFFGCVYSIDGLNKVVRFTACKQIASTESANLVKITPLDDFAVELSEEKASYRGNQSYKLPDKCNPHNINSCPDIFNDPRIPIVEITSEQFFTNIEFAARWTYYDSDPAGAEFGVSMKYLYHLTDIDKYVVVTEQQDEWIGEQGDEYAQPDGRFQLAEVINQYGALSDGKELKIAPCPMQTVGYSPLVSPISGAKENFLLCGYLPVLEVPIDPYEYLEMRDMSEHDRTPVIDYMDSGVAKEEDMLYDHLWLVVYKEGKMFTREYEPGIGTTDMIYWDAETQQWLKVQDDEGNTKYFPYIAAFYKRDYTLSPFAADIQEIAQLPKVDETKLYRFKFLSSTLPSPTNIFLIQGKKYACVRLTAHFTVLGMSELVEGEFYEITD